MWICSQRTCSTTYITASRLVYTAFVMADEKTNAIRILISRHAEYQVHTYDPSDGHNDAESVARKVGVEPDRLFKTLVTVGGGGRTGGRARTGGGIAVFCVPGAFELDVDKAAAACGAASVKLVDADRLPELTGYVRGGCSPIGMKRDYPIYIDESARDQKTIVVSAGKIGLQIEVSADVLAGITGSRFADLV